MLILPFTNEGKWDTRYFICRSLHLARQILITSLCVLRPFAPRLSSCKKRHCEAEVDVSLAGPHPYCGRIRVFDNSCQHRHGRIDGRRGAGVVYVLHSQNCASAEQLLKIAAVTIFEMIWIAITCLFVN